MEKFLSEYGLKWKGYENNKEKQESDKKIE